MTPHLALTGSKSSYNLVFFTNLDGCIRDKLFVLKCKVMCPQIDMPLVLNEIPAPTLSDFIWLCTFFLLFLRNSRFSKYI